LFENQKVIELPPFNGRVGIRNKRISQKAILDQSIYQMLGLIQPEEMLKRTDTVPDQNNQMVDVFHDDLTTDNSGAGWKPEE
jgi:hypothetical protein